MSGYTEATTFFTNAGFENGETWDCQVPVGVPIYEVDLSRSLADTINNELRRLTIDNPLDNHYIGPNSVDCTGAI